MPPITLIPIYFFYESLFCTNAHLPRPGCPQSGMHPPHRDRVAGPDPRPPACTAQRSRHSAVSHRGAVARWAGEKEGWTHTSAAGSHTQPRSAQKQCAACRQAPSAVPTYHGRPACNSRPASNSRHGPHTSSEGRPGRQAPPPVASHSLCPPVAPQQNVLALYVCGAAQRGQSGAIGLGGNHTL